MAQAIRKIPSASRNAVVAVQDHRLDAVAVDLREVVVGELEDVRHERTALRIAGMPLGASGEVPAFGVEGVDDLVRADHRVAGGELRGVTVRLDGRGEEIGRIGEVGHDVVLVGVA